MAAAVAERIELLDIADAQAGLLLDPGAQADLEGAVRQRIERAERQAGARLAALAVARHQDRGLPILHGDDRGGEANFDRRQDGLGHASVPIPKFVSLCSTLACELRNRRTLATY